MAVVNWDGGSGNREWDGTDQNPNDTPLASNKDAIWGSIADVYQKELGRSKDRIGQDEYANWAKDLGGGQYGYTQNNWQDLIHNSAEAQAYRTAQANKPAATTTTGSGDWRGFGQAWLSSGGRTVSDLQAFINAHPEYGATLGGSKGDKVTIGGRTFDAVMSAGMGGGLGASWNDITGGETNTSSTYGNNANTELYINEILSRLQRLRAPIDDPMNKALQIQALQRVQSLQGQPYTNAEDAALVTRYREPLTQARDAQYQRNREEASRRGFAQSSGLLGDLDKGTDRAYQQAVASGANDLAVRAVDEKNSRAEQALAILSSLVGQETARRNEIDNKSQQLVSTAALLPGLDESRLKLLLEAANTGTQANSSSLSNLLQLAQLNQNANQVNSANSQNNASTFGAYLAQLLANLTGQGATA
jgi:hypothetical protein